MDFVINKYLFSEQARVNGFVLTDKFTLEKKYVMQDSVETNYNILRDLWPSPRRVRVQLLTSPRQV